jgi:hypothetical protein
MGSFFQSASSTLRDWIPGGPAHFLLFVVAMQTIQPRHRTAWKQRVFSILLASPVLASAQPADLIVSHAYVVTMNASKQIYSDGAVVIKTGTLSRSAPARSRMVMFRRRASTRPATLSCPA